MSKPGEVKSELQDILHKKLKPYICNKECSKSYGRKFSLLRHISEVHKKLKLHKCDKCPKVYGQKSALQNHNNFVHEKIYLFQCQECNKSFGPKSTLQQHIFKIHKK